jgi:outer membrane protein OmpA-like peptidoglycan-associated protein
LHNDRYWTENPGDFGVKAASYRTLICGAALTLAGQASHAGVADAPSKAPAPTAASAERNPNAQSPLLAQEAELRTSLAPTAAVIMRSNAVLEVWYPVRLAFAADATDLLPAGVAMLDLLARSLRQYAHTEIVVAVYTDAIGSTEFNLQQSQARAAAVVSYLVSKGVSAARLVARGAGKSTPLEAPNTPEGRDLNRRLQVVITPLSS